MKGRINLASAARKASAKRALEQSASGREVDGGRRGGERGEREGRAQHTREPEKHNRHADTTTQNNTDFEAACMHGRGRWRTFVGRSPVGVWRGIYKTGVPCTKVTGDSRMGADVGFRMRISALEAGIAYVSYSLALLCVCVCLPAPCLLPCLCCLRCPLGGLMWLPIGGGGLDSPFLVYLLYLYVSCCSAAACPFSFLSNLLVALRHSLISGLGS